MELGIRRLYVEIFVGKGCDASDELLVHGDGNKLVSGSHDEACSEAGRPGAKLTILDGDAFAAEDVHAVRIPKLAEGAVGGNVAVAEQMNAARVSDFGAIGKAFNDAEGLNVADHLGRIDEVIAHRGIREEVILLSFDNVSSWREEPAG